VEAAVAAAADQGGGIEMKYSVFHIQHSGFRHQVSGINRHPRSGQALVELMVGLVVVMVLVAGILQIASMTSAHTDAMAEARQEVAPLTLLDLEPGMGVLSDADYIKDWHEGADERRLSRDDYSDDGNTVGFQDLIVDKTAHDPSGWAVIDSSPNNRISALRADPMVITSFGLVKGSATESARLDMLPAFRHLVYRSDTIDVEATAWMTLCKGIY